MANRYLGLKQAVGSSGQEPSSNVEMSGLRGIAQDRSTAGLEGQINESPLSFTFWRIARFAGFEGRGIPWCGFVIAAALIRFPCRWCYRLWSWLKWHKCSPLWFKNYSVRGPSNLVIGKQRCCAAPPPVSLTSAWIAACSPQECWPKSLCLTLTKNGGAGERVFTTGRRF